MSKDSPHCQTCWLMDRIGKDHICRAKGPQASVVVKGGKAQNITAWSIVVPDRDWCPMHSVRKQGTP